MSRTITETIRKTIRVVAYAVLGFILLAVITAIVEDPQTASAPIATLEQGVRPESDALRITDGLLYWSGATTYYRENLRTGEKKIDGYYVPVVSAALAKRLDEGEEATGFSALAVMTFITQETAQRDFPFLSDNPFRTPDQPYPAASMHEVHGEVKPGKALPLVLKQSVDKLFPGLDQGRLLVVAHDAPDETGFGLLGLGVILFAIVGVIGQRREKRAQQAPASLFENQGAMQDVVLGDRVGHDTQPRGLATLR